MEIRNVFSGYNQLQEFTPFRRIRYILVVRALHRRSELRPKPLEHDRVRIRTTLRVSTPYGMILSVRPHQAPAGGKSCSGPGAGEEATLPTRAARSRPWNRCVHSLLPTPLWIPHLAADPSPDSLHLASDLLPGPGSQCSPDHRCGQGGRA